ncbi:MAG: sulfatase activating formylglycine-generating enzyme [Bradymonadia bacterium]|jgi:formylglycine-generating enzyme required for sulfatase activity
MKFALVPFFLWALSAGCVSFYDVGAPVLESRDATTSDATERCPDALDASDILRDAPSDGPVDAGADVAPLVIAGWALAPAGSFVMGSPAGEAGRNVDETQHRVVLTRAFEMMENEVTNEDWASVFDGEVDECGACPVASVSWFGALAYANALSSEVGLEACYTLRNCVEEPESGDPLSCNKNVGFVGLDCEGYRLPTASEWEYAARAGADGPYPNEAELSSFSICRAGGVSTVGTRLANAWGIRDVLGNVDEWVFSTYEAYPLEEVTDPTPQSSGALPVTRGGGYDSSGTCRIADRDFAARDFVAPSLGFRLVRSLRPDQVAHRFAR